MLSRPLTYINHCSSKCITITSQSLKPYISGQDEHVGLREDLRFDADPTLPHDRPTYVGLSTPPRSLKLDENIYLLNEEAEAKLTMGARNQAAQNGYVSGPKR